MATPLTRDRDPSRSSDEVRARLLATMPVTERRLDLAGIPTAVLEGGGRFRSRRRSRAGVRPAGMLRRWLLLG